MYTYNNGIRNRARSKFRILQVRLSLGLLTIGSIIILSASCGAPSNRVGINNSSAPGAATDLNIIQTDSTSLVVEWTAPTESGTRKDGTALSQEGLGYYVYYMEETEDQRTPTADIIRQNKDGVKKITGVKRVRIIGLNSDTRYFVTITTFNNFAVEDSESLLSEIVEASTQMAGNQLTASLSYQKEYSFVKGYAHSIEPEENLEALGIDINYTIKIEGVEVFDNEPTIDENGIITIPVITNTASASYLIEASANGYDTMRVIITITIFEDVNPAHEFTVSTYHSKIPSMPPVELGQAVKDTGTFSLEESVLVFNNIVSGEFTIHIGDSPYNYDDTATINMIADGSESIGLSKTELANLPLRDGSVLGISGPGITGTVHLATYHPSKIYSTYDLQAMRVDLDGSYVLQKDIVFTFPDDGTRSNYEAVGNKDADGYRFTGSLDGAGYSIQGIQIVSTYNYQGLFGVIEAINTTDVAIQNFVLRNIKITGNDYIGSIAGLLKQGTISGHFATGNVTGNDRAGGLVGAVNGSKAVVIGHAAGNVSGLDGVGGLVGVLNSGKIYGYTTGEITGSSNIGALVGISYLGTISGYATGTAVGSNNVGGLVGSSSNNNYNDSLHGYARNIVRKSSGMNNAFGKTIGTVQRTAGTLATFSSIFESKIYDARTETDSLENAIGILGTEIALNMSTSQIEFEGLRFGMDIGEWTWVSDGKWPAINIDDIVPAEDQPIDLCIFAQDENTCIRKSNEYQAPTILYASTYYSQEMIPLPLEYGPAIVDSGIFALPEDAVILSVHDLSENEYFCIYFGPEDGDYDTVSNIQSNNSGSIDILKSHLTASVKKIGLQQRCGHDEIVLVASYQASNIYSRYDLQSIRQDLEKDYVLQNDIVFEIPANDIMSNFEPLGNINSPFTGLLDGAGKRIEGIQIVSSTSYQGLFGVIEANIVNDVSVRNLELKDFKIQGKAYVGSVAGWIKSGTVNNVDVLVSSSSNAGKVKIAGFVVDSISLTDESNRYGYGGGLFGRAGSSMTTGLQVIIQNSSSAAEVDGIHENSNNIGGLVGQINNQVLMLSNYSTGTVKGNNNVGGLMGTIVNRMGSNSVSGYSTGYVSGKSSIGGLVGKVINNNESTKIIGYSTGNKHGDSIIGGLVGYNTADIYGYSTGFTTCAGEYVGGLVGQNNGGIVTGYSTGITVGIDQVGGLVGKLQQGTVVGYSRSNLRRMRGSGTYFGQTIGKIGSQTDQIVDPITYSSAKQSESITYHGFGTGTQVILDGIHGRSVTITPSATQSIFTESGRELIFGTELGQWTWVDGKWPAINIDDISLTRVQAIEP